MSLLRVYEPRQCRPDSAGYCFADLYATLYDEYCDHKIEDQLRLLDLTTRLTATQTSMSRPGWVPDHVIFSAFIKMIFVLIRYQSGARAYNLLYVMYVLNSSYNLFMVPTAENSQSAVNERVMMGIFRKAIKERQANPNQKLQDIIIGLVARNRRAQQIKELVSVKWLPQYQRLRPILAFSTSVIGILDYVIGTIVGIKLQDPVTDALRYASGVLQEKTDKQTWLEGYLGKKCPNEIFYVDFNRAIVWTYHEPITFQLGDTLLFRNILDATIKPLGQILALFEAGEEAEEEDDE